MLFNLIGDSAVAGNFFNMGSKHERSSSSIFAIESQLEVILLRDGVEVAHTQDTKRIPKQENLNYDSPLSTMECHREMQISTYKTPIDDTALQRQDTDRQFF